MRCGCHYGCEKSFDLMFFDLCFIQFYIFADCFFSSFCTSKLVMDHKKIDAFACSNCDFYSPAICFLQAIRIKYLHPDSDLQNFALQVMEMLHAETSVDTHALVFFLQ